MRVTVSVKGRFWSFYLAKELQKHGHLRRLITTYPVFETVKYGVERDKIKSLWVHEVAERLWRKAPKRWKSYYDPQYVLRELLDFHASWNIPEDTDLFVAWAASSLHSIRRAKQLGAKTVLERGSSHVLYQRDILREEYERYGIKNTHMFHPKLVEKQLVEYAETDYISIPSHFVKRTFLECGVSAEKLLPVPFGVELANFYPIPKRDRVFRVVYCGALSIRKGVYYLLRAFSELNLPNTELWLIGSRTDETDLFLPQFSSPSILHKGPFPEFELYKHYSQGSVFCLPSIEEGLAMVQPQAMACGLPVICTTNTGGEDIVRDGQDGFIVPIRDVEALKDRILYLYENQDTCVEMGRSAWERVQQGFTWADYGAKVSAEYQRILGGDRGGS